MNTKAISPQRGLFFLFCFLSERKYESLAQKSKRNESPQWSTVPTVVPVASWYSASLNAFRFVVTLVFALWPLECSEANCFWSQGQSSICPADVSESLGRSEGWFACFSGCRVPSRKWVTFFPDFLVWPWESLSAWVCFKHRHSFCYRCRHVRKTIWKVVGEAILREAVELESHGGFI